MVTTLQNDEAGPLQYSELPEVNNRVSEQIWWWNSCQWVTLILWHHTPWLHHEVSLSSTTVRIKKRHPSRPFQIGPIYPRLLCPSCCRLPSSFPQMQGPPPYYIVNTDAKCAWQGPKERHQHFCGLNTNNTHSVFASFHAHIQGYMDRK